MNQGKIRVLVAKPGLDGHDRGAKVIARALRDAGMEVNYTGCARLLKCSESALLKIEYVVLKSIHSEHNDMIRVFRRLLANGQSGCFFFVGGIIQTRIVPLLREMVVSAVY